MFSIPAFLTLARPVVTEAVVTVTTMVTAKLVAEGTRPAFITITLLILTVTMVTLQTTDLCGAENHTISKIIYTKV